MEQRQMQMLMCKKGRADNRGMSLVEVIIAITILGIVAVPVLHSLTTAMVYNAKARNRQEMTLTAESIMETFKGYSISELCARFTSGGRGIEGISVNDTGNGFSWTYSSAPGSPASGDTYTFSIKDMKAENGQLYDVTITATPKEVKSVMVPEDMEPARDAVFKGERSWDINARQKAVDDFNARQDELRNYFAASYSDAVAKIGNDVITIKDKTARVYESASGMYYVNNYIKLHERQLVFDIETADAGSSYIVKPRLVYQYFIDGYPYYKRIEPGSVPDPYPGAVPGSAEVMVEEVVTMAGPMTIRYPASGYLEAAIDISSACTVDGTEKYIYKNPTNVGAKGLERIFIYYYPQYNLDAGKDKVIINNSTDISNLQCYILKQRTSELNDTVMQTKENSYQGNVEINNTRSGSVVLFHNFDDNIGGGSTTVAPSIMGAAEAVRISELDTHFKENRALTYSLELEVKQGGRTITKLEGSMNEGIK